MYHIQTCTNPKSSLHFPAYITKSVWWGLLSKYIYCNLEWLYGAYGRKSHGIMATFDSILYTWKQFRELFSYKWYITYCYMYCWRTSIYVLTIWKYFVMGSSHTTLAWKLYGINITFQITEHILSCIWVYMVQSGPTVPQFSQPRTTVWLEQTVRTVSCCLTHWFTCISFTLWLVPRSSSKRLHQSVLL